MKEKIIYELKSFLTTFISIFALEAYASLVLVYNGNWTMAVINAVGVAALRSAIKAVLQLVFPNMFKDLQKFVVAPTPDVPVTPEQ